MCAYEKQLKCERQTHLGEEKKPVRRTTQMHIFRKKRISACVHFGQCYVQYIQNETMQSCQMKGEQWTDADTKQISERM